MKSFKYGVACLMCFVLGVIVGFKITGPVYQEEIDTLKFQVIELERQVTDWENWYQSYKKQQEEEEYQKVVQDIRGIVGNDNEEIKLLEDIRDELRSMRRDDLFNSDLFKKDYVKELQEKFQMNNIENELRNIRQELEQQRFER